MSRKPPRTDYRCAAWCLYKNGVGYFEHTGRVHGSQELKIDFTSAQLNDVLKSLTVLDLNGGKIYGVGYNSVAPIGEQLKALRLPLDESTTLEEFLNAPRGTRIEVRTGAVPVAGRLLSIEEKTTHKGQEETSKTFSGHGRWHSAHISADFGGERARGRP